MGGSVAAFVMGVDRLLTRGHELFPAAGGDVVLDAGGGVVPAAPAGGGFGVGVDAAGGVYGRSRAGAVGLDAESGQLVSAGDAVGQQGRTSAGLVRDQARAQAAVIAPMTSSAAGVRLLVSTMDDRLAAMQQQLDATGAENRLLALRLRQLVQAYQGLGSSGAGTGMALPGLGGFQMPGGGVSGLGSLGNLGALPTVLMNRMASDGSSGGVVPVGAVGRSTEGDLPPGVGSEKGLQKDTILAERAISAAFPEIRTIGGWRADSLKWHPNGQAIDVMIPDPGSSHGKALGDSVLRFALQHRDAFSLNHVIWRQTLYNPDGSSQLMENRGSPTQNHMDHVHIATNGGGYPRGGEVYRL